MLTRFFASQSVNITMPGSLETVRPYMHQSQRIISALVDTSRIDVLAPNEFRLNMRSLRFMMLSIQPVVDMRVSASSDGTLTLQSTQCVLRGLESFNPHFHLDLRGELMPVRSTEDRTFLAGQADLEMKIDLPHPFHLTPRSILEATGNSLLRGVLGTMKQRLNTQLVNDYREWAMTEGLTVTQSPASRWSRALG